MQHELATYIPIPKGKDFTPHFNKIVYFISEGARHG